jgi:hypothetical protein
MTTVLSAPQPPARPKVSSLAIVGLVLGATGLCTVGAGGLAGLAIGIVSLLRIRKHPDRLRGEGLAIAAIAVSAACILLGVVLAAPVLLWFVARDRFEAAVEHQAGEVQLRLNVMHVCQAAMAHAAAHEGQLPPADSWPQALKDGDFIADDSVLADPADRHAGRAIAMNARLAGARLDDVRERRLTVLFFECPPGSPPAGGPELLAPQPRHEAGYVIGFCDGHTEPVPSTNVGGLVWDPKQGRPNE